MEHAVSGRAALGTACTAGGASGTSRVGVPSCAAGFQKETTRQNDVRRGGEGEDGWWLGLFF